MYSEQQANRYSTDIWNHINNVDERQFFAKLKKTGVVKCVDGACGHINGAEKPGSIWYDAVFRDLNKQFDIMTELGIYNVTAVTHLFCGLLAVKHRLYTLKDQQSYAADINPRIIERALNRGVNLSIPSPISSGSAVDYMNFMNSQG